MQLHRVVFLSLLALILTACAGGALPSQKTEAARKAQGTPILAPTGESATETQKPRATSTPNEAGTLAVMGLQATERANQAENTRTALTVTMQSKIDNYVILTQTAQRPAQTATKAAQETQSAILVIQSTARIESWTATAAAPGDAVKTAKEYADAQNAPLRSFGEALGAVVGPLVLLMFCAGFVRVLTRKRSERAPVAEDAEIDREDWQADGTPEYPARILVSIPESIATDKQLRIVADKIKKGLALTHSNFTPTVPNGFSEGQFTKFCDYLLYNHPPLAVRAKNNGIEPLPSLRRFLRNKVDAPTAPFAPDATPDASILPVDRQTDAPTNSPAGQGGVIHDDFGILDGGK